MRRLLVIVVALVASVVPATPALADAPDVCSQAQQRAAGDWVESSLDGRDTDWFKFTNPRDGFVQVVLGGLEENYSLELYRTCGSLTAAPTHRAGRQFEELYRNLVAGTYLIRITPASGRANGGRYALRFRPIADGMRVLSASSWQSNGYRYIVGEVVNNTSERRHFVQVEATLYDSSGRFLRTEWTFADLGIVYPRERSPFMIMFDPPASYDHHTLGVIDSDTTFDARLTGKLTHGRPYVEYGTKKFPGQVRNPYPFAIEYVQIFGTFYNDRGGVMNADFTFADPNRIPAGGTGSWELWVGERYQANRIGWAVDSLRA